MIVSVKQDLIKKLFINGGYNDSAQKTPAVRKNVRGMNAPITNNATIIPIGFSSGIVGFSFETDQLLPRTGTEGLGKQVPDLRPSYRAIAIK